jgi:hypothetical protein
MTKPRWQERLAEGEVSAALTGLILGPNEACVPGVPAEFLQQPEDDALRDRLFVGEFALTEAGGDVGDGRF